MRIKEKIADYAPQAIEIRHQLHQNPELGYEEYETTARIKKELESYGIEIQELPGMKTGVIALIRGDFPGKTVALREDIDALPLEEVTGLSFASQKSGVSHACGHDVHCASLLLTAHVLQDLKHELHGNVRLIFQPAEEKITGAQTVVKTGIMQMEPKANSMIGVHVSPEFQSGTIAVIKGPANASTDSISITVIGKGGHGAHPYRCVDPIVTAAYMLTQLQSIVSRENPAVQPAVLTFGTIHGGTAFNVIPEIVELQGTLRTFNEEGRHKMWQAIERIATYSCEAMRAQAIVKISEGVPALVNDAGVIDNIIQAAKKTIGADHIITLENPSLGSDDFSVFLNYCPGAQFRIGSANFDPLSQIGLHNPANIFDDHAIITAAQVMVQYVIDICQPDV